VGLPKTIMLATLSSLGQPTSEALLPRDASAQALPEPLDVSALFEGRKLIECANGQKFHWRPKSKDDILTIYLQEDKTGSSSLRTTLRKLKTDNLCIIEPDAKATDVCRGSAILLAGDFGACAAVKGNRCRYFTMMREPIDRLVSEYNYFCKQCSEDGKFCGRLANTTPACPGASFLDWAGEFREQYIHHFSRNWDAGTSSAHKGYYASFLSGFENRGKPNEQMYKCALENITRPNFLAVKTENLTTTGWERIQTFLGAGDLGLENDDNVYERNVDHEPDQYNPSPAELAKARELNKWDVKLYDSISNR